MAKLKNPAPEQAGNTQPQTTRRFFNKSGEGDKVYGYSGSGNPESTQDKTDPVAGKETAEAYQQMVIRTIDRSPKDVLTAQTAIIAAESVYYPNQQRLFDLFSDILIKDAFLRGIINKRISQVVNKKLLCLRDGDKGPEQVPGMAKVIRSKTFKAIMKEILWTQFWGVNGLEFIPGRNIAYNMVLKKHIKIKTQLITYEQFGLTEGIDYTKLSNVWILGDEHVTGGDGASHDLGLLSVCCFLSLLKKGVISDWAQYIQIFGSPAIVVKYKGFDNQAQLAAEKILKNIGNSMRMTIPDLMNVEFVDGKMANGNGDLQNAFRKACNEELVVLVLGNTETTGHGSGTTGVGAKAHGNQQLEIIRDDMDYLTDNLNSDQFMHILKSYALPVDGAYFEFDKEVDVEYLKSFMPVVVQAATQIGLPVSKKQLYDITGLMQPEDEADTIQLYPTLGQQPTTNDPDTEDGKPSPAKPSAPRPVSRSKAKPEAISLSDVSAMLDEKLRAFFAQAL